MSILKRLKEMLSSNKNSDDTSEENIPKEEPITTEESDKIKIEIVDKAPENEEPEDKSDDAVVDEASEDVIEEPVSEIKEVDAEEESPSEVDVEETSSEVVEIDTAEDADDEISEEVSDAKNKEDESSIKNVNDNEKSKDRVDNMSLLEKDENLLTRDAIDEEFTQMFVDAGADTVEHCFQCGTCSGSCPSGRRTPYKVRQIVRKSLLGMKEAVISDPALWMCTTCYTCQERCPRSVEIVDIIKLARNEAAKAGYMAPAHKMTGLFVSKAGHGVPINDATKELRLKIGLEELPPTTHTYPEALKEVQEIIKNTGFDDLIGLNWETMDLE